MTRAVRGTGWLVAAALVIAGCMPAQPVVIVPAGPLAPILPTADGEPPVECRGVPLTQCLQFGTDPGPDASNAGVVRYIVTCTAACTVEAGRVLIHQLGVDGVVSPVAEGVYGE